MLLLPYISSDTSMVASRDSDDSELSQRLLAYWGLFCIPCPLHKSGVSHNRHTLWQSYRSMLAISALGDAASVSEGQVRV